MPCSGVAFTLMTSGCYGNALSLRSPTCLRVKPLTSKTSSKLHRPSSWVMMTSTYRSHPHDDTVVIACESKGWSTLSETHRSWIMAGALHTMIPCPSKVKSWETKRLLLKDKTSNTRIQIRGTNTCHHALR
jgi:hypothetical protein